MAFALKASRNILWGKVDGGLLNRLSGKKGCTSYVIQTACERWKGNTATIALYANFRLTTAKNVVSFSLLSYMSHF